MSELADLFPGFAAHHVDTQAGRLFLRQGGQGKPLLLLHGFPQSHVMWHKMAARLAEHHTLIIADLPGYGWSAAPSGGENHMPYTKRAMATLLVEAMEKMGHARFSLMGHDRGARAGYRLAMDHPGRVERLVVLDIVPTHAMWHRMDRARALQAYHWSFLAQPRPLPEKLLAADPIWYLEWTLASWSGTRNLKPFDPRALAHYRAAFGSPDRLHAMCEDYRAGATQDLGHDEADIAAGRILLCPTLAIWGDAGIPSRGGDPLEAWRALSPGITGQPVPAGHFLCEEAPDAVVDAVLPFLRTEA
ncbi:alpha/beta fold hydrolase [Xanthobacter sp. TB0139]|uniref:alpha/beta fold hydrolase n=1 Tax=Xanthobacter sp. TB0139 TaxID=3459178 RepID=UPI004039F11D